MSVPWFYTFAGAQQAPVSWEELCALASSGRLAPTELVWSPDLPDWKQAALVPGLFSPQSVPASPWQPAGMPPPPLPYRSDPSLKWILPVDRSVWAIVAGYCGLFSIVGCGAPFALITGIVALRDLKRNPHLGGRGRAIFGIVMGAVFTVFYGLGLLAWVLKW